MSALRPMTVEQARALSWGDRFGIDAADLMDLELQPLRWIVPGLLPEGTTVLVAPPKVGKSCLVYQIAAEVALGGYLFGERVESGAAMYLALEDGQRRGQDRLKAALAGRTMPRGRLTVRWSAPRIGDGLEDLLVDWLDAHQDATFVAIDTLGKVRPKANGKSSAYDVDVQDIGRLQELFRDRGVALVLVHHTNKGSSDDFVEQVSGTYGVSGSVDTIVNISRKRQEAFGAITVAGRDVADNRLSVRFTGLLWSAAPEAIDESSIQRQEIYLTVKALQPTWPKKVADKLDLERTNVQHRMTAMADDGTILRTVKGYVIPSLPHHLSHSNSDESDWGAIEEAEDIFGDLR